MGLSPGLSEEPWRDALGVDVGDLAADSAGGEGHRSWQPLTAVVGERAARLCLRCRAHLLALGLLPPSLATSLQVASGAGSESQPSVRVCFARVWFRFHLATTGHHGQPQSGIFDDLTRLAYALETCGVVSAWQ